MQLESSSAEEVTFDFSLKAQSKMLPFILAYPIINIPILSFSGRQNAVVV